VEIDHPTVGRFPMHGLNIHYSDARQEIRRPAPLLGQHNAEVYAEWLGLDPQAVARLEASRII
jgi:formyl-CoA transferase